MEKKWIPIVAVVFVALIFIGEALTYTSGVYSYDSSAERNGTSVDYSISSSGTNDYSAVLFDNDGFKRLDRLAIYIDEGYRTNLSKASSLSPVIDMDTNYYAEQIERALKLRSFENVTICDRQGLINYMNETDADPRGCGILSPSYALPGEIYTGNSSDPLMDWLNRGGSLYWVGSIPGSFYYNNGELTIVEGNQSLFFGSDCVNTDSKLYPDGVENDFTKALGMIGFDLYLGVDTSRLPDGKDFRAIGCKNGSVFGETLLKYGDGMIVQSAGPFTIEQVEDLTQMMASGLCFKSTIVGCYDGKVTRGTVTGSFDSAGGDVIYLYIGKAYTVYGRAYDV